MKRTLPLALCAFLLAGCAVFATGEEKGPACPKLGLLQEAETLILPEGAGAETAALRAQIVDFYGSCNFDKPGELRLELALDFAALQKSEKISKYMEMEYFIAVLSRNEDILQRQGFSVSVRFDNEGKGVGEGVHRLSMPLPSPAEAAGYKVVAGFIKKKP